VAPAGSINSNVVEMTSWMRLLLNNGTFDGKRVISERYVREMTRPQMISGGGAGIVDTNTGASFFNTYGLGLGVRDYYGRKLVSHTGGIDGMLSSFAFIPQERLGVVVLTNTEGQSAGNPIANYILNRFLGVAERDLSKIALDQSRLQDQRADSSRRALEARRVAGTKPSLALDRYVGRYENRLYGDAQITLEGGTLVMHRGPFYNGKLEHWHFDTFRADWGHPRMGRTFVTFALDAEARVNRLTIEGLGEYRRAADRAAGVTSER
jgi:CubicO group peptidase (beta-lactamase class C family)